MTNSNELKMTKLNVLKKRINKIYKMFPILKNNQIKIKLVNADDLFVGIFRTYEHKNRFMKTIELNAKYFLNFKNKKFLEFIMLHEIAHAVDFILSGGWRLNEKDEIVEHDELFQMICEEFNIPFYTYISELGCSPKILHRAPRNLKNTTFDPGLVGLEI